MESVDKLVEIPPSEWIELRDLYSPNWPDNHIAWYTINSYVNWVKFEPNIKHLKIYSLNGTWRSDGTYVVADRYQLLVYSLETSNEKLRTALRLADWSIGVKVTTYLERYRSAILDIVQEKNLKIESDVHLFEFFMTKEEANAKTLTPPENITLKPLSVEHAEVINDEWPNKHDGSLFFIQRLIKWNLNVGAFNDENELIGWCLRYQGGQIGTLQVLDKFRRRGLGGLLVLSMSKSLAEQGMDTYAFTFENNLQSQGLFKKLGFKKVNDAYILKNEPFDETFKWID